MNPPREHLLAATFGILLAVLLAAGAGRPTPAIVTHLDAEGVRAAVYLPRRQRLLIHAAGGGGWVFEGVPPSVHRQFLRADSPGEWVARHLLRAYPCHRVHQATATNRPEEEHHAIR